MILWPATNLPPKANIGLSEHPVIKKLHALVKKSS